MKMPRIATFLFAATCSAACTAPVTDAAVEEDPAEVGSAMTGMAARSRRGSDVSTEDEQSEAKDDRSLFTDPRLTNETVHVRNFHEVSPGIYRGGHPNLSVLQELHAGGIRTILSLHSLPWNTIPEPDRVRSLGMAYVSATDFAMHVDHDSMEKALAVLSDESNYPVYVHCQRGTDRTGLAVGLFRVKYQGWAPQAAYDEMKKYGFQPWMFWFRRYFEEQTGFHAL